MLGEHRDDIQKGDVLRLNIDTHHMSGRAVPPHSPSFLTAQKKESNRMLEIPLDLIPLVTGVMTQNVYIGSLQSIFFGHIRSDLTYLAKRGLSQRNRRETYSNHLPGCMPTQSFISMDHLTDLVQNPQHSINGRIRVGI